jgi:hypothetical protein
MVWRMGTLHQLRQVAEGFRADAATSLASLFRRQGTYGIPADVAHRIVWLVPSESLRAGWRVDSGSEESEEDVQQDVTAEVDQDLGLPAIILQAYGQARKHGAAYLFVIERGAVDYAEPLAEGPHDIAAVHVVRRSEVTALEWEHSLEEREFSRPSVYQVAFSRHGVHHAGLAVHRSRLIRIDGMPSTDDERDSCGVGPGALELYSEPIRDLVRAWGGTADLAARRSMPVMQLGDSSAQTAATQSAGESGAMRVEEAMRSVLRGMASRARMMVVRHGDMITWTSPTVSGTGELITVLASRVSMVEGEPLSYLFGQAPPGLSTDDESGRKKHDALLERGRTKQVEPVLLALYDAIMGPDPTRRVEWPPLSQPTELEASQTSLNLANRDSALIAAGVMTEGESRHRFDDGVESSTPILDDDEWEEEDLGEALVLPPELPQLPGGDDGETPPDEA